MLARDVRPSVRNRRHSSNPSLSGNCVSVMTRSGGVRSAAWSASAALEAVTTVNPAFLRLTSNTRKLRASESTRRRLFLATARRCFHGPENGVKSALLRVTTVIPETLGLGRGLTEAGVRAHFAKGDRRY